MFRKSKPSIKDCSFLSGFDGKIFRHTRKYFMKKILCGICLLCAACACTFAKEGREKSETGMGFDFALAGLKSDFALSTTVTSPWFFDNSFAFRLNAEYYFPDSEYTYGYPVVDFSIMGGHLMQTANIRLYGGGGPMARFPLDEEYTVAITGQGFFGFEFFMTQKPVNFSFFTEIGGGGFGFHAKAGMRYTLPMYR